MPAASAANLETTAAKDLFEKLLHDEEAHADFLETQLSTIEAISIANYLAEQMKD